MKSEKIIDEVIGPETWGNIKAIIIGLFILFVAANFIAWNYFQNVPNKKENFQAWKWEMLFKLKKPLDWMLLGDSSALNSLNPIVFEKELNGIATNLCTTGGAGFPNVAWMIQEHIRRYGPPKNVVILNDVSVWTIDFIVESPLIPLPLWRWLKLKPSPKIDTKNIDRILLKRFVPLFSLYQFMDRMRPNHTETEDRFIKGHRSALKPGSFIGQKMDTIEISLFENQKIELTQMNKEALENIIQNADQYRFNVYLVNQPRHAYLSDEPSFVKFHHRVQQTFEEYAQRSPYIHYLKEPCFLPLDRFSDKIHLFGDGAVEYSKLIANEIKKVPKGEISHLYKKV